MTRLTVLIVILMSSVAAELPEAAPPVSRASASHSCTSPSDDQALSWIAEQWKDGYNRGDAPAVAALYAEDAYYLTQHFAKGILHGRREIQAYVQRGVDARYHIDSIEILSTDCSGDLAYTVGRYDSTNAGQKAFGVNIVVLKKVAGKWIIVAHESAVPDPATAIPRLAVSNQP